MSMLWADRIVADIRTHFADRIARGECLEIRDEKTLSGKPHIGSLRSCSMHATIADILTSEGVANRYRYEINDTDALDTVPVYVPADFAQYIGRRLKDVPSPSGTHANYAEEMAEEYTRVMTESGYPIEFYRQSERYESGAYDVFIRTALEKKDLIRRIYKEVSGSDKAETWHPVQVICEGCGKIATTQVTDFDGETVGYTCTSHHEFTGCGFTGRTSPFGGRGTLPWKVEWAAKWCVNGTDIEGAGKDHYTAGGSRQVANRISEEVFGRPHPFDIRHEFILVGGAKMSSSKGKGATADGVAAMLPTHIFRFMMIYKDIMKTIDFSPEGDTIPLLFDSYDAAMRSYYLPDSDEKRNPDQARIFQLVHISGHPLMPPLLSLPKFSQIVFLCQMPHLDLSAMCAEIKGAPLTSEEEAELAVRVRYARAWLEDLAPEPYRFRLGDYAEKYVLDETERAIVREVVSFLKSNPTATGHDIHAQLHELKGKFGVEPKQIFQPFYRVLLDRESGPQLGFMLSALPRAETIATLEKVGS